MKTRYKILIMIIPIFIFSFLSLMVILDETKIENVETTEGIVSEYEPYKRRGRNFDKPGYIILNNEKYFIMSEIYYGFGKDNIKELLSIDSNVILDYYYENDYKYIVGISKNNTQYLTIDDTKCFIDEYTNRLIYLSICVCYTYLLFLIIMLININTDISNLSFNDSKYLSKIQIALYVILGIILAVASIILSIIINKWLYFGIITLLFAYIILATKYTNKYYYGNAGILFKIFNKKYRYSWNAVKEIIICKHNKKYIILFNFKEKYNLKNYTIKSYVKYSKDLNNKFVYKITLSHTDFAKFELIMKRNLKNIYEREYKKIINYLYKEYL